MRSYLLNVSLAFVVVSTSLLQAQQLSFYIEQAKLNSPLIQDSKNQSEAAQLETERLRSLYTKAQISVSGSYMLAPIINRDNGNTKLDLGPDAATNYSGYDLAASNGGVYQGLLNVNQPLFNNTRYETAAEQALIGAKLNQNSAQLTAHDLEKFVTDQYILCLQDFKQTNYLTDLISIIIDQQRVVSKLVDNGIAKQSDLSLLIIESKTQQAALATYKATYRRDLYDLRVICGIADTTYQVLEDINLQLGEDVEESHFTEKYRLDSLNLLAAQKMFELKYKPSVGLFANTGLNAVYAPTIANRFGMSAGINFTLNLSDGGQRKINQERTAVLLKSTSAYKSFFYNQNRLRKSKVLAELQSIDERLSLIEDQLKEYQKLLQYYNQELSLGQLSVINYISILKNQASAQRDLVMLQTNQELLINLYNYWNW